MFASTKQYGIFFAIKEYHKDMSSKGNSSIPSNDAQIHSSGANNWLSKCVTERKKGIHTESSGQQLLNIGGARAIHSGNESTILISEFTPWVEFVFFLPPLLRGEFPRVSWRLFLSSSEETQCNIFKIQFYSGQQMDSNFIGIYL